MSLLDLLQDPLFRSVMLVFWLLPCAIQDCRTRQVSNWLTVPLFLLAWPAALLLGNFPLTLATFIGVYVVFQMGAGLGSADGKIAVGLAAMSPQALLIGVAIEALAFVTCRLIGRRHSHLPGAVGFYVGVAVTVGILLVLPAT